MSHRLDSRLAHIADLACGLHDMECGHDTLDPRLYHALALQLRRALAVLPDGALQPLLMVMPRPVRPVLAEALQAIHFERHGLFLGAGAQACDAKAQALWARLQQGR
jgi:hypothetical protein